MEELTEENKAYINLIKLLDVATQRGAFSRFEVLSYNKALGILDKLFIDENKQSED
tara:strand:+ start:3104 stop:3271 length:168 start_codon:yes stop_codon:yes gene_type:complete